MKKIYLGALACATIGIIYSFKSFNNNSDEPFCVEIKCKNSSFKEVIYADYSGRANTIAKDKYPNCSIGNIRKGLCK